MIDRIRELMEHKGFTSSQFADTVDVPRAVISHILSGRNKPSLEVVTKVVSAFPDVSMSWLLLGEGDMLIPLAAPVASLIDAAHTANATPKPQNLTEDSSTDSGKVQKKKAATHTSEVNDLPGKTIEQIVIFYSDKTFTAYKP
ncbi:transcriptional regulator with XRE-family HTH domain [Pontibacter aydingkolensis]|uniref:Helix-turn-helix domain-containing protein n=1 Tax=Pontibacter aydingkolensis TaxID=1911536 RepID=A0ABS7CTU3_9BACT|nr:helix-turn-helix transcriptional regulator [Pontibacter aydingkolensis]MBW7467243.1 helix-turn-helix domain-containing protein [Pontibacter aydingkolensis]